MPITDQGDCRGCDFLFRALMEGDVYNNIIELVIYRAYQTPCNGCTRAPQDVTDIIKRYCILPFDGEEKDRWEPIGQSELQSSARAILVMEDSKPGAERVYEFLTDSGVSL